MTKVNKTELLKNNLINTFFKGYVRMDLAPIDQLVWALHTFFLPLSLTGAGIKTLVDINTRHAITDDELDKLKNSIENLSDTDFDELVKQIRKYEGKSNASRELLIFLTQAEGLETSVSTYNSIHASCKQKSMPRDFTAEQLQSFKQLAGQSPEDLAQTRRQFQREKILEYLTAEKNAGKKLQHVIKEETGQITLRRG